MVRLQKNADRSSGHSAAAGGGGRVDGRDAGARMGGSCIRMRWLRRIPIATTARHSAQQIAFNEVGRQAIMADPDWNDGNYYGQRPPARGLAVARMVGHITYMSDEGMREKFGRRLRRRTQFEVESYLQYRGSKFVDRFDANSYLYITRAMDYFDLTQRGSLASLFESVKTRFLVISFTSDWLYPSYQSLEIVQRAAQPQLRRGVLRTGVALRARCVSGGSEGADRDRARIPGEHSVAGRACSARVARLSSKFYGRSDYAIIGELIEPNPRARSGLRRGRAAGLAEGAQAAWTRAASRWSGAACRRRSRAASRCIRAIWNRRWRIIRTGVRLRDPQPDAAGDAGSAESSARDAAHRAARDRGVPEFRPLERARWRILWTGGAPKTELFPHDWYDSPNIHFLTVLDFEALARPRSGRWSGAFFWRARGR